MPARVSLIQDQFVKALQIHLSQQEDGARLTDILTWLPMLHSAASVLLHSKMFYVPFILCVDPQDQIHSNTIAKCTVEVVKNSRHSDVSVGDSGCEAE